jgi:hypothetical protein
MKACCCCSITAIYTFRAAALGFWRCRTGRTSAAAPLDLMSAPLYRLSSISRSSPPACSKLS